MFRNFGPPEIIIIVVLLIVIFGWKRLPDAARSLGRSARVFKSEVDEMKNDAKPQQPDATGTSSSAGVDQIALPTPIPPVQQQPVQAPPVQAQPQVQPQPPVQPQPQPQPSTETRNDPLSGPIP